MLSVLSRGPQPDAPAADREPERAAGPSGGGLPAADGDGGADQSLPLRLRWEQLGGRRRCGRREGGGTGSAVHQLPASASDCPQPWLLRPSLITYIS